jgi:ATP-dependent helicase/nuclease subunit A
VSLVPNDTVLRDEPTQDQRRAIDPATSAWVSASAGTGKTKVLTDRVLSLMLAGTAPQRILCLTFTKAAAAEMANRIADRLGEWTTLPDADLDAEIEALTAAPPDPPTRARARALFTQVLDAPGGMNIQTLHAFCQSLLGRFPLEAAIAPHFRVTDERDAGEMLEAAREEVLAQGQSPADSDLAQALATVTKHIHETSFADLMSSLAFARGDLRQLMDRFGSSEGAAQALRRRLGLGSDESAGGVIAAACDDAALDLMGLRSAALVLATGTKTDAARGVVLAKWLAAAPDIRGATFNIYAEQFLAYELTSIRKTLITATTLKKNPGNDAILESEASRLLAAQGRLRAAVAAEATASLLTLGSALIAAYGRHKDRMALLDFDDLILTARNLLRTEGIAPWVLYKLDGGIDHVLIDEAQDTNPTQWDVIEALTDEFFACDGAAEALRTVFAVGDIKQSIFSFQKADPAAFPAVRDRFSERLAALERDLRQVSLTYSFRSTKAVLQAVDAVFAQPDAADGVAVEGETIAHRAARAADAGLVEVWAPVAPRATDAGPAWKPPIERVPGDQPQARLARLIARRIARMISDKEILESKNRPIRAGDVMVLVRRRTGFVTDLVRELKRLQVPVAGVDRMILTEQMAVMDLIALGRFLLQPEDDLTLATVLKGPLIGFDEEALFRLAHGRSSNLWATLRARASEEPAFKEAAAQLSALLADADYMPPFEFYARLLGAGQGRERLLARLGPDAEDPIGLFLDLALAFERTHPPSLEGFLHWVETGALEVKRDLEQGERDAVRVMTVHGAKGLQAPIVFLPDTMSVPSRGPMLLWPPEETDAGALGERLLLWPPRKEFYEGVAEAERARVDQLRDQEYRRLLYVALTRAEDRLYVCGWLPKRNKAPDGCWYNLIRGGIAPIAVAQHDAFLANDGEADDPAVLRLTCPQERLAEAPGAAEADDLVPLPGWSRHPAPPEPEPTRPLAPSRPDGDEPPVAPPFGAGDERRFLRGRLVHRLLQSLPDLDPGSWPAAARAFLSQPFHGLDIDAQAAIAAETIQVLEDPQCRPVFGPGSMAEVPLVGILGGRTISARIDRLVVTPEAITIIDYKTNRPAPVSENKVAETYLRQMAAYRAGLHNLYPGKPLNCLLLWTDGPHLMRLSDEILDRHAP